MAAGAPNVTGGDPCVRARARLCPDSLPMRTELGAMRHLRRSDPPETNPSEAEKASCANQSNRRRSAAMSRPSHMEATGHWRDETASATETVVGRRPTAVVINRTCESRAWRSSVPMARGMRGRLISPPPSGVRPRRRPNDATLLSNRCAAWLALGEPKSLGTRRGCRAHATRQRPHRLAAL